MNLNDAATRNDSLRPFEDSIANADSTVVAIFDHHTQAEEAVRNLQKAGFDMKKLSIIGKNYHTEEHVTGFYTTGDRVKYWGKLGAFWGGLFGLLMSAGLLLLPGVGHVLIVLGPLAAVVGNALEGAVIVGGLDAIGAALYSLGVPKDSVLKYESAIKASKFALIAHGTAEEAANARRILEASAATNVETHTRQAR